VIKAEQDLPVTEGGRGERVEKGGRGRNDPNTYLAWSWVQSPEEQKNKKTNKQKQHLMSYNSQYQESSLGFFMSSKIVIVQSLFREVATFPNILHVSISHIYMSRHFQSNLDLSFELQTCSSSG
jgi:hypothetical protein